MNWFPKNIRSFFGFRLHFGAKLQILALKNPNAWTFRHIRWTTSEGHWTDIIRTLLQIHAFAYRHGPSTIRSDSVRLGSIESQRGSLFNRWSRTAPLFRSTDFCSSSVRLDSHLCSRRSRKNKQTEKIESMHSTKSIIRMGKTRNALIGLPAQDFLSSARNSLFILSFRRIFWHLSVASGTDDNVSFLYLIDSRILRGFENSSPSKHTTTAFLARRLWYWPSRRNFSKAWKGQGKVGR